MIRPILKHWQIDELDRFSELFRLPPAKARAYYDGTEIMDHLSYSRIMYVLKGAEEMDKGAAEMREFLCNSIGIPSDEDGGDLGPAWEPVFTCTGFGRSQFMEWLGFVAGAATAAERSIVRTNPTRKTLAIIAAKLYVPTSEDEWLHSYRQFLSAYMDLGMSRVKLGPVFGVSAQTLINWHRGTSKPSKARRGQIIPLIEELTVRLGRVVSGLEQLGKLEACNLPPQQGRPQKKKSNGVADDVVNAYRKFGGRNA